jgi:hypothetical protein
MGFASMARTPTLPYHNAGSRRSFSRCSGTCKRVSGFVNLTQNHTAEGFDGQP